jgi:hypothetical protein
MVVVSVALVALMGASFSVWMLGPIDRPAFGDAPFYTGLASSMVHGDGYVLARSPWPDRPHLSRLPVWPVLIAAGMELAPNAHEFAVMRYVGILIHAASAVLLSILTYSLCASPFAALLAGIGYALYPPALELVRKGCSEPAFVMIAVLGLLLILSSRRLWVNSLGALISGVAVLDRSNYIVLPVAFLAAACLARIPFYPYRRRFMILAVIFMIPPFLWMLRNYSVSRRFPLLSALEGETLYGANNQMTATDLAYWGTWVLPDWIPGESPKSELGTKLDETALNDYYHARAVAYFKANWRSYPRLLMGKLIRAFVPIPWEPTGELYTAFLCRGVLYAGFFFYATRGMIGNRLYKLYLIAAFLIILTTTVVYYGTPRFTFLFEVFLIPCLAAGVSRHLGQSRRRLFRVASGPLS